MSWDDIVYLLLLLVSISWGEVIRRLRDPRLKQLFSSVAGLIIVFTVSGFHIAHCLLETAVNGLIICCLSPKYCHGVSFGFSFLYLLFFRFATTFGLPPPPNHTNAIQMLLTLKLVGLALEVSETAKLKKQLKESKEDSQPNLESLKLSVEYQGVSPSFLDIFHYTFCYIGVLTGPFYKYRTYRDMIQANDDQTSHLSHALLRLKLLPLYATLFVISSSYFPLSYAESDVIFERSVLYRLWYMTPLFFTFRMRFYSGFILSEVACITAGLGAYPAASAPKPGQGPTSLEHLKTRQGTDYNFETIHNIDEYAAEFHDVRGSLKSWNMTVQYWLAVNVHRRFPVKALRTVATMLVSAFWHGVHSGYYLSMLTVPFILVAEDAAKYKFRHLSPKLFDFVAGFAKIQWFSYMGVAFSLLAMNTTLAYWKSIYFVGHVAILLVFIASRLAPSTRSKVRADDSATAKVQ